MIQRKGNWKPGRKRVPIHGVYTFNTIPKPERRRYFKKAIYTLDDRIKEGKITNVYAQGFIRRMLRVPNRFVTKKQIAFAYDLLEQSE